tara:strand:- start:92 stop:490 length:399 start_codon:yes stop_codon:yes gene_type:complete
LESGNNIYEGKDLILNDSHVGEIITLKDFNDRNIIVNNLKKKGKIKLISKGEDLVKFFFKGRYTIEETGNMCSNQIQCQPGVMDIKPEKINGGLEINDISLMMSNFEVMINNFGDVPRVDVKAFNVDNVLIS